jgi:hypothetical protein
LAVLLYWRALVLGQLGQKKPGRLKAIFAFSGGRVNYEDTNDAERLSVDPTMRQVVGGRATEHTAASTSEMGRFETEVLTQRGNLKVLTKLSGKWIDRLREHQPMRELILDMNSSVSETYGEQEGTAYNGHFGCTCYHPLFCFNQFGDVEQSLLRDGNVHSAKDLAGGAGTGS